jgi:hypothetical protein
VKLVNLTPHPIKVLNEDGNVVLTIPVADGYGERPGMVQTNPVNTSAIQEGGVSIPVIDTTHGELTSLPATKTGVTYIVSMVSALAAGTVRGDLVYPGQQVRDGEGTVIGCRGLVRPV